MQPALKRVTTEQELQLHLVDRLKIVLFNVIKISIDDVENNYNIDGNNGNRS